MDAPATRTVAPAPAHNSARGTPGHAAAVSPLHAALEDQKKGGARMAPPTSIRTAIPALTAGFNRKSSHRRDGGASSGRVPGAQISTTGRNFITAWKSAAKLSVSKGCADSATTTSTSQPLTCFTRICQPEMGEKREKDPVCLLRVDELPLDLGRVVHPPFPSGKLPGRSPASAPARIHGRQVARGQPDKRINGEERSGRPPRPPRRPEQAGPWPGRKPPRGGSWTGACRPIPRTRRRCSPHRPCRIPGGR